MVRLSQVQKWKTKYWLFGFMLFGVFPAPLLSQHHPDMVRIKELNIHYDSVRYQVNQFRDSITGMTYNLTAYNYIKDFYKRYVVGRKMEPEKILNETVKRMEILLKEKVDAVTDLVKVAEEEYKRYKYNEDVDIDYLNNKKLLSNQDVVRMKIDLSDTKTLNKYRFMNLKYDTKFNDIQVNPNYSTIHVPTNVFDKAPPIQNGVKWSAVLDAQFKQNKRKYKDLTWQYFCSSDGFLRIYPGMKWPRDNKNGNIDLYDCRVRNWYTQGSTSPKNIIILIDTSGSMKGLRMVIALKTVEKILDTLSDDDHFNIIQYSDKPSYVDECFNGTLWPSNAENKKLMSTYIKNMKIKNIANLTKALNEAFDLFDNDAKRRKSKLCNKAIMLITDGAQENYVSLFKERNWNNNKTVRVFSFLIGAEVPDNKYTNWMACANKGYYVHISTIADVQESIQHYMRVLSRPMVISRSKHHIWTPMYADYTTEVANDLQRGVQFITSIAKPVYDIRNETFTKGHILGVMGSDVSIKHLMNVVPKDKLGPNSFVFLTTRHGYVMYHPELKPAFKRSKSTNNIPGFSGEKPDKEVVFRTAYNNYDITDMLHSDDVKTLKEFRRKLLKGFNKIESIKLKVPVENEKRLYIGDYNLYFKKVQGTGFSFGFAIPKKHGDQFPARRSGDPQTTDLTPLCQSKHIYTNPHVKIAPWRFCEGEDLMYVPVEKRNEIWMNYYNGICLNRTLSKCLTENLLSVDLDIAWKLTTNSKDLWKSQASHASCGSSLCITKGEPPSYIKTYERHGIQDIFCGMRNGITVSLHTDIDDSPPFAENNTDPFKDLYYKTAFQNYMEYGIDYTFSIPLKEYEIDDNYLNTTSVTIALPVVNHEVNLAVTGLKMKYRTFTDKVESYLNNESCDPSGSKQMCFSCHNSSIVSCYILDLNGYILYNNVNPKRIGVFMSGAERDGDLMMTFVLSNIYTRFNYTDYQSVCMVSENEEEDGDGNSADFLINPFRRIASAFFWILSELLLFLTENWVWSVPVNPGGPLSREQMCEIAKKEAKYRSYVSYFTNCGDDLQEKPCHKTNVVYKANMDKLKKTPFISDSIVNCEQEKSICNRTYVVQWIEGTNMIFVAAAADCNCAFKYELSPEPTPSIEGKRITYKKEQKCKRLKEKSHEFEHVTFCIDNHKNESFAVCGQEKLIVKNLVLVIGVLVSLTRS